MRSTASFGDEDFHSDPAIKAASTPLRAHPPGTPQSAPTEHGGAIGDAPGNAIRESPAGTPTQNREVPPPIPAPRRRRPSRQPRIDRNPAQPPPQTPNPRPRARKPHNHRHPPPTPTRPPKQGNLNPRVCKAFLGAAEGARTSDPQLGRLSEAFLAVVGCFRLLSVFGLTCWFTLHQRLVFSECCRLLAPSLGTGEALSVLSV